MVRGAETGAFRRKAPAIALSEQVPNARGLSVIKSDKTTSFLAQVLK
jgi:hypothetical protein